MPKEGRFSFQLSAEMKTLESYDRIDRFFSGGTEPIAFKATMPKVSRYFQGEMLSGNSSRMFVDEK